MWSGEFRVGDKNAQRRERRFPLRVSCKLRNEQGDEIACDSGDVSLHGIRIDVESGPAKGAEVKLRATLPSGSIWLSARVVHSDATSLGLEFHTSEEGYSQWSSWVAEWA